MAYTADSSIEEGEPLQSRRSVKHRQFSLYASKVKADLPPLSPSTMSDSSSDTIPQLPPVPISPRWDSLSNGSHVLLHSPKSGSFPAFPTELDQQPEIPPLPDYLANSITSTPRDSHSSAGTEARGIVTGIALRAKSSQSSMRQDAIAIENFSRPRKQSIKLPLLDALKPRIADTLPPDLVPIIANPVPHTPPWQRSRDNSVSSSKSIPTFASPPPNTTLDASDAKPPRLPSIISGSAQIPAKPTIGIYSRVESAQSAPAGVAGGAAPWMSGDELRSSFRSQLTTSTTPGTAATERSSVMTKNSSVNSVYANTDEPSLEDVMGMYEKGFADDTDGEDNILSDSDEASFSRPATAMSEVGPLRRTIGVSAESDSVPSIPEDTSRSLDAEIRKSKMIFSNPDFISSIPAVSGQNDDEVNIEHGVGIDKEPSTETVDLELSVSLDEPRVTVEEEPPTPTTAPSVPAPLASPTKARADFEDPGSRDRYGFKKENQYISRQQYDEWNKGYSQYLARRRKKWVTYMRDCTLMTDGPIRFPAPNAKTKRFVRKGIPPDWRGAAWFYYAGGPAILGKNSGLYVKLLQQPAKTIDAEAIERDLHRTFPDNIQFKTSSSFGAESMTSTERNSQATVTGSMGEETGNGPRGTPGEPPIITSLRRVLHAFSVYNPRIGYCQSLNFLAGLLLLFVETEENCFWLLNVITHIYLPGTHEMSLEGSKVDLGVLMAEIRDTMPEVWEKIGGELEGELTMKPTPRKTLLRTQLPRRHKNNQSLSTERLPPITLCMTAWFMSCYIGTLPIETTLRVWDVFFYEGSKTLFRIAMAIFKQGEPEIRSISDPMEMFGVVQAMPRKMLDTNGLMDLCFKRRNGFNHLNQDVIDGRRQERRDKARKEKEEHAQRGRTTVDGYVTEVESTVSEVRRKGTLFGRRKRDFSQPRFMRD